MSYTLVKLTDFSVASIDSAIRDLLTALDRESAAVASDNDWKVLRDRWMARKNGILTQLNDLWLKAAPKDAKRDVGQRVNEIKAKVEQTVDATQSRIQGGASAVQWPTFVEGKLPHHGSSRRYPTRKRISRIVFPPKRFFSFRKTSILETCSNS